MEYGIYEITWMFFIYAFLGWCIEVIYASVTSREFVNRGFLNGVVCPIYGFGAVSVILFTKLVSENIIILFIVSVILTSILELITGFILEKVFHEKWWDYSDEKFNIRGYICLKFSIAWGVFCVFLVKMVQPVVYLFIDVVPEFLGKVLILIFISTITADFIYTLKIILNLKNKLKLLNDISVKLRELSDGIGESIFDKSIKVVEKVSPIKGELNEYKVKREELKLKYKELVEKNAWGHNRILKAFPNLNIKKYNNVLEKIKEAAGKKNKL